MDRERQREIARKGGRAAHEKGTAHEFTSDEARAAGRKGGERVSANRDHMSRIGRLGGKHSAGRRQATRAEDTPERTAEQQSPEATGQSAHTVSMEGDTAVSDDGSVEE
jgi:general stress protein YciG